MAPPSLCEVCQRSQSDSRFGLLLSVSETEIAEMTFGIVLLRETTTLTLCASCLHDLNVVGKVLQRWKDKVTIGYPHFKIDDISRVDHQIASSDSNKHHRATPHDLSHELNKINGNSAVDLEFSVKYIKQEVDTSEHQELDKHGEDRWEHLTGIEMGKKRKKYKERTKIPKQDKIYKCDICSLILKTKDILTKHTKRHLNENSFKCPHCPSTFNAEMNLKRHVKRTHEGIKEFLCRFCPKEFWCSSTLKVHERVHTNERPYECPFSCGLSFHSPLKQRRHARIHTQDKHYACRLGCDKRFVACGNRNEHERNVHTSIRFDCPKGCGKQFRRNGQNSWIQMSWARIR